MGDGDGDGTPDYLQPDVASLPEDGGVLGSGEDYVSVACPDGSAMFAVTTDVVGPGRVGGGSADVTVRRTGPSCRRASSTSWSGRPPGSTQTVVIYYDATAEMNAYSTYTANGAWSELPATVKVIPRRSSSP